MAVTGAEAIARIVADVCERNATSVRDAAERIRRTLADGGLLRPAGAGHSLATVMEVFFRAGGLAGVRPIWHPRVLPLHGASASTAAEREPGLGRGVAEEAGIEPRDTVLVVSSSGINPYPVEIAQVARERGATVIAITAASASRAASPRAGARLLELADVVLDTGAPRGDVTWPAEAPSTAAASSLAATALWMRVQQEIVDAAPDVELWRSANVEGNDSLNRAVAARWAARIPEL
ncbi:sugar isomerase domain-containing protein [Agrococcus sp. ARC_14]|uniref:sugar isomerase domain-containing protein n=1 Tax=Agrococcus sp. ARC_14 TaxID=2919927 RepID=UPI001F05DCE8|nr:sugar isomerase domain-containing protein [Agrococcus sp. ARC_14]MCH1881645.1 sugar isomerase domain-containing protein [Agrococcus sp. ARC_14]